MFQSKLRKYKIINTQIYNLGGIQFMEYDL